MSWTILQDRTEILARPGFRFQENLITNKIGAAILQAQVTAVRSAYQSLRLTDPHYQKSIIGTGLAIPTGIAWGANGSLYTWNSGSTPVLTADIQRLKQLWFRTSSGTVVTATESTFDTDSTPGSGIPDSASPALGVSDVYHEFIGEDLTANLIVYGGSTAAPASSLLEFTYIRTPVIPAADADLIDIPNAWQFSQWDVLRNQYLDYYIGFHQ